MSRIAGKNVLVTGGASGIGRLMGHACLEAKARALVIWDVNEKALFKTAADFQAEGFEVYPYVVDLCDTAQIEAAAQRVLEEVGTIDLLFNNAGIVVGKDFVAHSAADIDRSIQVNTTSAMHVTRMFLPAMIAQHSGHIVNIASAAGLMPNPGMSVYAASKWAMVGWSESLRLELEREYRRLRVTTVMPSFINTGMFQGAKQPRFTPLLKPEDIARRVIEAVRNNDVVVQEPWTVKLAPALRGILPVRLFDFVAGEIFNVYDSMNTFQGRKESPEREANKKD